VFPMSCHDVWFVHREMSSLSFTHETLARCAKVRAVIIIGQLRPARARRDTSSRSLSPSPLLPIQRRIRSGLFLRRARAGRSCPQMMTARTFAHRAKVSCRDA